MVQTLQNWAQFILAGKAIFTILNTKTEKRFTFKVKAKKNDDGSKIWFVSVLTGSDNNTDYAYLGMINGSGFKSTRASKITENALSFKAFNWLYNKIYTAGKYLPEGVHIYHEGRCGRCGRRLTVPESIQSGFGPECINLI